MKSARTRRAWPTVALHAWLALCLLLAQGLGQGHRVAHLGFKLANVAVEQGAADSWGHALGSADCQLFDQLAHGDQIAHAETPGVLLALTTAGAIAPLAASVDAVPLSPQARGPPPLA